MNGTAKSIIRCLLAAALTVVISYAQSSILGVDPGAGAVASVIVVSGEVHLVSPDGETKLPSDLRISVDCHHGDQHDGGSTSQSGQFSFRLTPAQGAIDAGDICNIEAKSFGYESTIARFPIRQVTGMVNVGTLEIRKNDSGQSPKKERATVSATSLKAPANAVKLFDRGTRSLQQQKFADAAKDLEAAVKIYPEYAESWLNLGRARVSLESLVPARDAFLRAAELDPQFAGPPAELGLLAARQNDLTSAAKYLDESLRIDPGGTYQICYSDALVNLVLKRYDAAERSARAALRFGETPAQARAEYLLGMALLTKGSNVEARQRLLKYLELSPKAPEHDQVMKELARLDQLEAAK